MKTHKKLKQTSIKWIGPIPQNWQVSKIKYSTYVKGRVGWHGLNSSDFINQGPYLVTGTDFDNGIIKWETCYHVSDEHYNQDPYIKLKENDLLITKDGTIGKVALVKNLDDNKATLNSGVFVTRPLNRKYITSYMYWILNSSVFNRFFDYTKTGSTVQHLYQETFNEFSFPLPSLQEQKIIATHLDRKTAQIDTLISKKKRLIELLREERAAIINQAVTQGLNPDAKMKDSGIEWLGEIPEHWELKKLKYVSRNVQTGSTPPSGETSFYEPEEIDWFSPIDFGDSFVLNNSKRKLSKLAIEKNAAKVFPPMSVFLVGIGATLGKVGIVENAASSNQQINSIEFSDLFNPWYGVYFLDSIKSILISSSNAATLAILNQNQTKNILVTVPPKSEQNRIVDFIKDKSQNYNIMHKKIITEITLLQEYRTALISEVVTGKIDVRDEVDA